MSSVYIETTVVSYAAGRPSTNILVLAHQKITQAWWKKHRSSFSCCISPVVLDEISRGDPLAVKRRQKLVRDIPILDAHDEIELLAKDLINHLKIPQKATLDAYHIAFAAFHEVRFLVTWNCAHIANANHFSMIGEVLHSWKLPVPIICTPEELGESS